MNRYRVFAKIILLGCILAFRGFGALAQDTEVKSMMETLNKEGKIALYINFETSKAEINAESQGVIDQVVLMLNTDKALKISVEGHTDNAGNPKTNRTLSESRAKAVMDRIITGGIDKSRLTFKGWGAEKPLTDNNTEDAKARNRRVEIVKQ